MIKLTTLRFLIFLLLIFAYCTKDITIEAPPSKLGSQLFIESILYPGKVPKVFLSKSLPFFDPKVIPQEVFARGATVSISNGVETDLLSPDSTFDKFRCRWEPFYKGRKRSEFGQTYELNIRFEGKSYSATTTIDQSKIEIDSVRYTPEFFDVYGGHDGVIVNFKDAAGAGNYYRFQMNRMIDTSRYHAHVLDVIQSNCTQGEKFLVTDLGRTIFNDENADGKEIEMIVEVSFEYLEGDTTYVSIQSLDKNSAEFFQDMDDQLLSILNPFVEPVFLKSKIDGALGVFGSAVMSDSVLFIYPQDNP